MNEWIVCWMNSVNEWIVWWMNELLWDVWVDIGNCVCNVLYCILICVFVFQGQIKPLYRNKTPLNYTEVFVFYTNPQQMAPNEAWLTGIRNRQMILPSAVLLTVWWMILPGLLVPIVVRSLSLWSKRSPGWESRITCYTERGQPETEIPQQLNSSWSFRPSPARKSWSLLMTRLGIWDVSGP